MKSALKQKTGPKRTADQRLRDRAELARRYLQGEPLSSIGHALGLSTRQVEIDLKAIRDEWVKSAVRDFEEARAIELAKIDQLEQTYWEAYYASLDESTSKTQYLKIGADGRPVPDRAILHSTPKGQGNTAILQGIQWCIDRRVAIFGLDAPELAAETLALFDEDEDDIIDVEAHIIDVTVEQVPDE
jgi:hypothetical protein